MSESELKTTPQFAIGQVKLAVGLAPSSEMDWGVDLDSVTDKKTSLTSYSSTAGYSTLSVAL